MTISMKARQVRIDALNTVLYLLEKEIDSPTGFADLDGKPLVDNPLYKPALESILGQIEAMRDQAAYRQYRLADRKARRQEMRETLRANRRKVNTK